jgi:hypothetical protein
MPEMIRFIRGLLAIAILYILGHLILRPGGSLLDPP